MGARSDCSMSWRNGLRGVVPNPLGKNFAFGSALRCKMALYLKHLKRKAIKTHMTENQEEGGTPVARPNSVRLLPISPD